jgi:hypothetical protein
MEGIMRKVRLTMDENYKYETIKNVVDNDGNKKRAAQKLNCTVRTINRLILQYKKYGKEAFIHGNRGRHPASAFPLDVRNEIVALYINEYSDANIQHFSEIIKEIKGFDISAHTIRNWLIEEDVLSPKARRKTKKNLKKN